MLLVAANKASTYISTVTKPTQGLLGRYKLRLRILNKYPIHCPGILGEYKKGPTWRIHVAG